MLAARSAGAATLRVSGASYGERLSGDIHGFFEEDNIVNYGDEVDTVVDTEAGNGVRVLVTKVEIGTVKWECCGTCERSQGRVVSDVFDGEPRFRRKRVRNAQVGGVTTAGAIIFVADIPVRKQLVEIRRG